MDQMDVTATYLHVDIEEEIYVKPPKEIVKKTDERRKSFLFSKIHTHIQPEIKWTSLEYKTSSNTDKHGFRQVTSQPLAVFILKERKTSSLLLQFILMTC